MTSAAGTPSRRCCPKTKAPTCIIRGNVVIIDSKRNIVSVQSGAAALIGVDDLVVVETGDALLVGRKDQMQRVREVVEILARDGRADLL